MIEQDMMNYLLVDMKILANLRNIEKMKKEFYQVIYLFLKVMWIERI